MIVFVATDLSAEADEAIRQAHAWASEGSTLVCCVVLAAPTLRPLFPQLAVEESVGGHDDGMEAARAVVERVAALTGRVEGSFEVCVERGAAYAEIVRAAETRGADLVVVGSVGRSRLRRLFLGSTAEKVVRLAHCSVLVARPSPQTGVVLAGIDLSEESLVALREAERYARRRQGTLTAVQSYEAIVVPPGVSMMVTAPVPYVSPGVRRAQTEASLQRAVERTGVSAASFTEEGPPVEVLVAAAEKQSAELLVCGSRGATGLARLVLGSVAEGVVRHAPCSTLIVRAKEARSP